MGDQYIVWKTRGKRWYTSWVVNAFGKSRVCCEGTPFKKVAHDYFDFVETAQREALCGENPYTDAVYAQGYRIYATLCDRALHQRLSVLPVEEAAFLFDGVAHKAETARLNRERKETHARLKSPSREDTAKVKTIPRHSYVLSVNDAWITAAFALWQKNGECKQGEWRSILKSRHTPPTRKTTTNRKTTTGTTEATTTETDCVADSGQ